MGCICFCSNRQRNETRYENATGGTCVMEFRHKLPLVTTAVIIALIMGTRFVSTVLTDDIGSVDPRVTLPPNQVREILEQQRRQQLRAFVSVSEGEVSRTEER